MDIVFDGPTGPEGPRFVEVEIAGLSVRVGEWVEREDGHHVLRFSPEQLEAVTEMTRRACPDIVLPPGVTLIHFTDGHGRVVTAQMGAIPCVDDRVNLDFGDGNDIRYVEYLHWNLEGGNAVMVRVGDDPPA